MDKVFLNDVQFTCSLPVQEVEHFEAEIVAPTNQVILIVLVQNIPNTI